MQGRRLVHERLAAVGAMMADSGFSGDADIPAETAATFRSMTAIP